MGKGGKKQCYSFYIDEDFKGYIECLYHIVNGAKPEQGNIESEMEL